MLGLAPLAAATLSDDGDRLPQITAGNIGDVALGGTAEGAARTAAVSPMAMLPVGGEFAGVGLIGADGAGEVLCAENVAVIGQIIGEASGRFTPSTTAVVALLSAASSHGNIELSGQSSGRLESGGATRRPWDLEGVSVARTALIACGAGLWGPTGAARGTVTTQSDVAGSIAVARRFEAESVIAGAAARGLAVEGSGQGAVESAGAIDSSLGLDSVAQARVAHAVTLANGLRLTGYAATDAISSAQAQTLGPWLAGQAFGSTLESRVAAMVGQIGISVSAQAALATNASADASLAASMDAGGTVSTRSAIAGALSLARELNAHALASGQAGRQIGITGAASGITETAADSRVARLEVTGASEARSGNLATMRHELSVSGKTELASAVSGAVIGTADWAGASDAITGTRAAAEAETSLQGESFSTNSINAEATDDLTILGNGAGHVSPVAQLRSDLAMADASMGTISSFGLGRGVFDVVRNFDGDVAVFGDSARAIGFSGQAKATCKITGTVPASDIKLAGSATVKSISFAAAAAQVSVSGEATGRSQSASFVQQPLKIYLLAESASPQTGKSNGTWTIKGHADGTLALMGSADGDLAIASDAAARAMLVARASGVLVLTGKTATALEARADAAGVLGVGRDSDAAVEIDGDAHRSISLHGFCEGQASITAKPRPLPLTATLTTDAANAAGGRASSEVTTAGSGTARAQSQAASLGHLAFSRTGAADVLILGAAGRGMPFLGISQALTPALAAANSSVTPRIAATAANVIHLDLRAEAIAPGGQAAGSNLACAQEINALWDLEMAAIAFRAPPALGRLELPRMGLSGRLVPTNAGRILRG